MKEIRIYVEGGGDDKNTKIPLRKGFDGFFSELKLLARNNKIKWYTIACGSRESAFYEFLMAKQSHTHAFNILLVDSENPVTTLPWQHLKSQDGWNLCQDHEENCHVMVQVMESWFMADVDSLKNFYGTGFRGKSIPKVHDVETIDKEKVLNSLKSATKHTQKGEYHKIYHGAKLLELIDTKKVRKSSRHCDKLFKALEEKIGEVS